MPRLIVTRRGAGEQGAPGTMRGTTGWSVTARGASWTPVSHLDTRSITATREETPGSSDSEQSDKNVISYIYIAFVITMAAKFINEILYRVYDSSGLDQSRNNSCSVLHSLHQSDFLFLSLEFVVRTFPSYG